MTTNRPPRAMVQTIPPPIGGWNARDPLPVMEPTDAIRLDNWIPDTGGVRLRKGYAVHASGLLGTFAETLMQYSPPNGNNRLFAALPTTIYDVTAAGSGTPTVTALASGRWQHTMFATGAGSFLVAANGADPVRQYDGSGWSAPAITGVTSTNLVGVTAHMNRLWFIEKGTLKAWYLPTSAVAGAATAFDLAPLSRKGGYLLAIGTWTRDGGQGPDDHAVFITSNGECFLYAGTDPASATTSALVGRYELPEPIGRRCFLSVGAELTVLTSQGLIPLSRVLSSGLAGAGRYAITDKISGAFRDAYRTAGTAHGWQVIEYPKANLLIVNVPVAERTRQVQYVCNVNTGAWCRFTGIHAGCWSLLGDTLYLGGNDGTVSRFDSDYLDGSAAIVATLQTAYSRFGTPNTKIFTAARPIFLSPPLFTPQVYARVDYDTSDASLAVISTGATGTSWGAGTWNVSSWGTSTVPSLSWQTVQGMGSAVSIAFAASAGSGIVFNGVDVAFQAGGAL